ncbi:MAG: hypothetical protein IPK83_12925 [Planctomycetes bacterium]|nr:hypothetical protein [Planctomycetota bacterium]
MQVIPADACHMVAVERELRIPRGHVVLGEPRDFCIGPIDDIQRAVQAG